MSNRGTTYDGWEEEVVVVVGGEVVFVSAVV
jgi:hypothetical protein